MNRCHKCGTVEHICSLCWQGRKHAKKKHIHERNPVNNVDGSSVLRGQRSAENYLCEGLLSL